MLIPKRVKLALNLATEIIPKLPDKNDGPLQMIVKLLAIADSAEKIFSPGKQNAIEELIDKYGLKTAKSSSFVSLFFDTKLHEEFDIVRFSLADYLDVVEAKSAKHGTLFFVEYNYGATREPEATFYHSENFDFNDVLQGLWESYEGRLHATLRPTHYGTRTSSEFATFSAPSNPLYGAMRGKLEKLIARHRRWKLDGIPRAYMFYGEPGTGKTSFAMEFAERLGNRTLKLDAGSLSHANVRDVTFMLENLQPDFLLIDDVDKADVEQAIPTVLDLLQRFKTDHADTSVLLTANTVTRFDLGFLRPNRIDTWVEFPMPTAEERREILQRYVEDLKAPVLPDLINTLVEVTENLSQDYLREIATQFKYEDSAEILANAKLMRTLRDANVKAKEEKAPAQPVLETKGTA